MKTPKAKTRRIKAVPVGEHKGFAMVWNGDIKAVYTTLDRAKRSGWNGFEDTKIVPCLITLLPNRPKRK